MYTLFFTADIQGSALCWKKLLNAAALFRVDTLIVSGNLIGTALQPMVREEGGTWRTVLGQTPLRVKTREEISALEEKIRSLGRYPCRVGPEEALELEQSPTLRQKRLEQEARHALRHWLELAEEKLKKTGRRLVMMAGEQDPSFVDAIIGESSTVERAHEKIITLNANHKLISAGSIQNQGQGADTTHGFTEEEMFRHLQDRVSELGEVHSNIFNIQIPPLDTTLCNAVCLNCARAKGNRSAYYPPGSAAVRRLIETYQPLLSLHGHTHGRDNKFTHIGRTLCCVPGNGRLEGLLSGFLITLKKSEILDFQPIQG